MVKQIFMFFITMVIIYVGFVIGLFLYQLYREHNKHTIFLTITTLLNIFVLVLFVLHLKGGGIQVSYAPLALKNYDYGSGVGCGTDSMGLTLNCNDILYEQNVYNNTKLIPGSIYTYMTDKNASIVHRMIMCLDENCNITVFKGDNNEVGEIVPRQWINGKVVMVEYYEPEYDMEIVR